MGLVDIVGGFLILVVLDLVILLLGDGLMNLIW